MVLFVMCMTDLSIEDMLQLSFHKTILRICHFCVIVMEYAFSPHRSILYGQFGWLSMNFLLPKGIVLTSVPPRTCASTHKRTCTSTLKAHMHTNTHTCTHTHRHILAHQTCIQSNVYRPPKFPKLLLCGQTKGTTEQQ